MSGELGREGGVNLAEFRGSGTRENLIICSRHQHRVFVGQLNLQVLCEWELFQNSACETLWVWTLSALEGSGLSLFAEHFLLWCLQREGRTLCTNEMLRLLRSCHHSQRWSWPLWCSMDVHTGSSCAHQQEGQELCLILALPLWLEGFLAALLAPLLFPGAQCQAQEGTGGTQEPPAGVTPPGCPWHGLRMSCLPMPCLENTLNRAEQTKCAFNREFNLFPKRQFGRGVLC